MFKFVSDQIAAARRSAEDQERLRRKKERLQRFIQTHPEAAAIQAHAREAASGRSGVNLAHLRDREPLRYLGYVHHYLSHGMEVPEGLLEGWPGPEPERAVAGLPAAPGADLGALAARMGEVQGKGYAGGLAAVYRQGRQGYLDEKMAGRIARSLAARNELAKRLSASLQAEESLRQSLHDSQMAELRRRAELEAATADPTLLLPPHLRSRRALPASHLGALPAWQEGAASALPPARLSDDADPEKIEETAITLVLLAEEQGWITPDDAWQRGLAAAEREMGAMGVPAQAVIGRAQQLRRQAGR